MQDKPMTSVQTIRMGFLDSDDRLLLDFVFKDNIETVLITRRITRRMIVGLAQTLGTSSAIMERVPASHKTDMLIWEHLTALQPESGGGSAAVPEPAGLPRKPA